MNDIGSILKRLREQNGLKGNEVIDKLKDLGIEISAKTLYGYESGRNSTNADMFLALCKIYKCQNIMETFSDSVDDILFTNNEWNIIEKYRVLDKHGKKMVDFTLNEEWDRSVKEIRNVKSETAEFSTEIIPIKENLLPNTNHRRTNTAEDVPEITDLRILKKRIRDLEEENKFLKKQTPSLRRNRSNP